MSKAIVLANPASRAPKRAQPRKPRNKRKKQPTTQAVRVVGTKPRILSSCADLYLKALTDPFVLLSSGASACIPDLEVVPSYKFSTLIRGTFQIGTAGVGFVAASPYGFGSDGSCFVYSGSTYTGTTIVNTGVGVTGGSNVRFPFTTALAPPTRLVGCGLRSKYVGTELNRSGVTVPLTALGPNGTLNGFDYPAALTRPDIEPYNNDRKLHGCTYRPQLPSQTQYTTTALPVSTATNMDMAILATGVPGEFHQWEMVMHWESIPGTSSGGSGAAVPGVSSSHSDLTGMSMIRDWLGSEPASMIGTSFYNTASKYIQEHGVDLARTAFTLATSGPARLMY